MKVTLNDAYTLLKLPYGASLDDVVLQYRDLASQYHHNNAHKKFEQVSCAYKRIISPESTDLIDMDMETMKDIFKNIIFGSTSLRNGNGVGLDVDDSLSGSDYSDDEFSSIKRQSQVQSDQIAKELISEEEKEKRKAEKRRAKKKKRREKKKLEKEQELHANSNGVSDARNETPNGIRSSDEGEGIDPNAAFVKKSKKRKPEVSSSKPENSSPAAQAAVSKKKENTDPGENGTLTNKSRLVAYKGNEAAHNGDYPTAIHHFTEAIKLEPSDYRFFGNRSYCYDRIMQFDKALADADRCIELSPEWPKGYFRRGRALAGIKLFPEAEKAFMQVLKLDRSCEEASKELTRVRTQQLIDMGFSPKDAERAVLSKNSLQQALDYLLAGVAGTELSIGDDVYVSGDDEEDIDVAPHSVPTQQMHSATKSKSIKNIPHHNHIEALTEEKKMDPTNPAGLTALWVGNVLPSVTESDLQNLFNRYGHVSSVRCLPEKYCAFVNFKSKETAGKAMNALQNHEVQGQHLLIKFPDNPIANGSSVIKETKPVSQAPPPAPKHEKRERSASAAAMAQKVSGPVNGDECYFWRTTGCQFGTKCRWKHLPDSKGQDRKPWQRVK